jgi:hypothetical protein
MVAASSEKDFTPAVSFGSFAEINDTPKAAVRAAPIEGEADLAIRRKRPFVSGKFWEPPRKLKR